MKHRPFVLIAACLFALAASAQAPGDLGFLKGLLDKYPSEINLWDHVSLSPRLQSLLGQEYTTFIENMSVNGPLGEVSAIVWTSGNRKHDGGANAALFLADTSTNLIEVYLLKDKQLQHYAEANSKMILDGDAQVVLDNFMAVVAQAPGPQSGLNDLSDDAGK